MRKENLLIIALSIFVLSYSFLVKSVLAEPFAYIANSQSNSVSVIDTSTNTVITTIPAGNGPVGVAVNPAGTRVYLTNTSGGVSVIDTSTNTVIATIPVDGIGVAVNPAGTRVYVTSPIFNSYGYVSVIDAGTDAIIDNIPVERDPTGVAVNPAGTRVYVINATGRTVSVIDTSTNTVIATIPVGGPYGIPAYVAVNPAGTRIYVTDQFNNNVYVIDTATNTLIDTIPVGWVPQAVAVNPTGTRVYVTNSQSNSVSVIDTSTNTVITTTPAGNGSAGVAVNPAGTRVYVTNIYDDNVSVIDTATNTVIATIPVVSRPLSIGQFIGPDGGLCTPPSDIWVNTQSAAGLLEAETANVRLEDGKRKADITVKNNMRFFLELLEAFYYGDPQNNDFFANTLVVPAGTYAEYGIVPPCGSNITSIACRDPGEASWVASFCSKCEIRLRFQFSQRASLLTTANFILGEFLQVTPTELVSFADDLTDVSGIVEAANCLSQHQGLSSLPCVGKALIKLATNRRQLKQVWVIVKQYAPDVALDKVFKAIMGAGIGFVHITADELVYIKQTNRAGTFPYIEIYVEGQ